MRKIITPYQHLLEEYQEYVRKVGTYQRTLMFTCSKNGSYSIEDIFERTEAAHQLGYEVILKANLDKLEIWYQKKRPEAPRRFR